VEALQQHGATSRSKELPTELAGNNTAPSLEREAETETFFGEALHRICEISSRFTSTLYK
jgi:hypothetical protein